MSTGRIIWLVIAAAIATAVIGAGLLLYNSRGNGPVEGSWIARMQRAGERPYTLRLRLRQSGTALNGEVEYPAGTASIEEGSFRDGKLTFTTREVPQSEIAPHSVQFRGEVREGQIDLHASLPDGGVATGVARRTQ